MKQLLLALALTCSVAACAVTDGTRISAEQLARFQVGKTTINEVTGALGRPSVSYTLNDGGQAVSYNYSEVKTDLASLVPVVGWFAGNTDTTTTMVTFLFDRNGVLTNVQQAQAGQTIQPALKTMTPR